MSADTWLVLDVLAGWLLAGLGAAFVFGAVARRFGDDE